MRKHRPMKLKSDLETPPPRPGCGPLCSTHLHAALQPSSSSTQPGGPPQLVEPSLDPRRRLWGVTSAAPPTLASLNSRSFSCGFSACVEHASSAVQPNRRLGRADEQSQPRDPHHKGGICGGTEVLHKRALMILTSTYSTNL